ncbi:MAG: haloacid dehalogenase-like hydrolase [Clostridia bacterium]|nr:haloacid dehalogenase-like hydrolase [Clostridia bacterium]
MNCYDFDKTIFKGDSSVSFYLFCLLRHKKMLWRLPKQIAAYFRYYVLHRISKTQMKEIFYGYFRDIPDIDKAVSDFWEKNLSKIKPFYLSQQKEDDIIISASPEFFLRPACQKLGISHLIASEVDPGTGVCASENCHGKEKVRRLLSLFPDAVIADFYSDSLSDTPLAELAQSAYLVKGEKILPWPQNK